MTIQDAMIQHTPMYMTIQDAMIQVTPIYIYVYGDSRYDDPRYTKYTKIHQSRMRGFIRFISHVMFIGSYLSDFSKKSVLA